MQNIAMIGGTVFIDINILPEAKRYEVKTPFGTAVLLKNKKTVFIERHGEKKNIPPHKINHQANMAAFKEFGIENIVGVSSVGSLNEKIKPGSIMIPDDYINLLGADTIFNEALVHITPVIDENLRDLIIRSAKKMNIPIIENGVYFQTKGPRLETKAEIRMIRNFADVVGMTMGSEASAAQEAGLRYSSINSVDNFAHGITSESLSVEFIIKNAHQNAEIIKSLFLMILET